MRQVVKKSQIYDGNIVPSGFGYLPKLILLAGILVFCITDLEYTALMRSPYKLVPNYWERNAKSLQCLLHLIRNQEHIHSQKNKINLHVPRPLQSA